MSYFAQATLARDPDFLSRVAACAAVENPDRTIQPTKWAEDHIWWMAAAPGFADAYEYAILNGNEAPGRDPAVITDGQILGAVQQILTAEGVLPPPEPAA